MSVREKINAGKTGIVAGIALIAVAVGMSAYTLKPDPKPDQRSAYFSTDDGQTFYKDSIVHFPPYQNGDKTAVMAMVFTDGKTSFVGYLTQFTPAAKKQLEEKYADEGVNGAIKLMATRAIQFGGTQIKLPGSASHWQQAGKMPYPTNIKSPSGEPADMTWPQ